MNKLIENDDSVPAAGHSGESRPLHTRSKILFITGHGCHINRGFVNSPVVCNKGNFAQSKHLLKRLPYHVVLGQNFRTSQAHHV